MDIVDVATDSMFQQFENFERALANVRNAPVRLLTRCKECNCSLPEHRKSSGYCVECKTLLEEQEKKFNRKPSTYRYY